MKDVQCKKKLNQVIPVSEAVKDHFEDHNSCYSCQDFDKCREEAEQNEIGVYEIKDDSTTYYLTIEYDESVGDIGETTVSKYSDSARTKLMDVTKHEGQLAAIG